jgi:predicted transcriptional regulator
VALTLRLDRARYTRLKILAARRARSGQEVLIKALDAYLEACATDCACLRSAARRGDN